MHHIVPVAEGGALYNADNLGTTCSAHHNMWEALRRKLVGARDPFPNLRCPHQHRTAEGRAMCEARRARQLVA